MSRFAKTFVCFAVACLSLTSQLRADNYMIEPSHTSIIFGISHLGYSYTYGRFNRVNGNFVWDNANPAAGSFQLAIDAASIDSNDAKRDEHLRSADFFNVKQYPIMSFQSAAIQPAGKDAYNIVGNLTIHGITKQVTLPVKKLGEGPGPYGKYRCGFFCQTTIKRSEFGMTNMLPNIGDQVAVTISFEGVRQGAAGSGSAPAPAAGSGSAPKGSGSATQGSTTQGSGSAPKGSGSAPKGSGSAPKPGSSGTR